MAAFTKWPITYFTISLISCSLDFYHTYYKLNIKGYLVVNLTKYEEEDGSKLVLWFSFSYTGNIVCCSQWLQLEQGASGKRCQPQQRRHGAAHHALFFNNHLDSSMFSLPAKISCQAPPSAILGTFVTNPVANSFSINSESTSYKD